MIGTHHITIFAATLYIATITLFVALHLTAMRAEIESRRIHQMELARAGEV